jgi:hypothetical protein
MAAAEAVRRMALLGGESSGKTTLARALAQSLGTTWVPEYGRQRWEELRITLSVDELVAVARRQIADGRRSALASSPPLAGLRHHAADHAAVLPARPSAGAGRTAGAWRAGTTT